MIATDAKSLWEEVMASEDARNKRLKAAHEILRQYHSPAYDGSVELGDPENTAFEYISLTVPQMIFENPKVIISGADDGFGNASDLQAGLNRWIRWQNFRKVGIQLAIDQCICWGVAQVSQQPVAGWIPGLVNKDGSFDVPMAPRVRRVPQDRYFIDQIAPTVDEARLQGVLYIRDHDDLLEEARRSKDSGWDLSAVMKMRAGGDVNKYRPRDVQLRNVDRKEVIFYEIWVPEHEVDDDLGPEQGFHGTIFTLSACDGGAIFVRKPRPFYGPAKGPFVLFGSHPVSDRAYPMSSLYPVRTQDRDLNAHGRAIRDAAARHKRVGLGDALSSDDANKINDAKNGDFLLVKGLDKQKVAEIEMGGVDESMLVYFNLAKGRRDQSLAMSDALRGMTSGDATATENAIASTASSVRTEFVKRQYAEAVRDVFERVGEYLNNDERSTVPMENGDVFLSPSAGASRIRSLFPGVLVPDDYGERDYVPFSAYDIQLDPMSMERQDQEKQQRNAAQAFAMLTQTLPLMAQFPDALPWTEIYNWVGSTFGLPKLGSAISPENAQASMVALSQMGAAGGVGGAAGGFNAAGSAPGMNAFMAPPGTGGRKIGQPPSGSTETRLGRRVNKAMDNPKPRATMGGKSMVK